MGDAPQPVIAVLVDAAPLRVVGEMKAVAVAIRHADDAPPVVVSVAPLRAQRVLPGDETSLVVVSIGGDAWNLSLSARSPTDRHEVIPVVVNEERFPGSPGPGLDHSRESAALVVRQLGAHVALDEPHQPRCSLVSRSAQKHHRRLAHP